MSIMIDRSLETIGACPACGHWSMHYRNHASGVVCNDCGQDQYAIVSETTHWKRTISPSSVAMLEEGLRVFGPSADGAVERDLASSMAREGRESERRVAERRVTPGDGQPRRRRRYDRRLEKPEPPIIQSDDRWITWAGGKCPIPDGTRFELRFSSGSHYISAPYDNANSWTWEHGDIVAYRVLPDQNKNTPGD